MHGEIRPLEVPASSQCPSCWTFAGEVAARTGMPASTLRYYERGGLVASAGRRGCAVIWPEVIQTLAVVALCRQAGFNLGEIQELLATGGQPPVRALAARSATQLRDHARQLTLLADLIDHFVGCPNANAFECEYFQDALRRALPSPSKWALVGAWRTATNASACRTSAGIALIVTSQALLNTRTARAVASFLPTWMSRVRAPSPAPPLLDFELSWSAC